MDKSCIEPKIMIVTDKMTDDINDIIQKISSDSPQTLAGLKNDKIEIIEQSEIIRLYANSGKVFALTNKGEYILRL